MTSPVAQNTRTVDQIRQAVEEVREERAAGETPIAAFVIDTTCDDILTRLGLEEEET